MSELRLYSMSEASSDIKLPPLYMVSSLLVRYDNHELGDLATDHPLVKLQHDLLNVCPDLVVGRDCADIRIVMNARLGYLDQAY